MTIRVVQWATGAMGKAVLRTMLDTPGMDVVGVRVYDPDKVGRDIGVLANRPETGVHATDDADAIRALDADVVVHAGMLGAYGDHDDEIVGLLESGKNVISINGYTHPGFHVGPRVDRLDAAARAGGVTLAGAGLNPGFIGEQLAVVATGVCARLDHVEIVEAIGLGEVRNPDYLFDALGIGVPLNDNDPDDPARGPAAALNGMYEETLAVMALRLGVELEAVRTDHRVHPARTDIDVAAGVVRKGTVGHTHWCWHGVVGGRDLLTMSIHWYVDDTHLDEPDPPLWRIHITGHPGVRISVDLEKHPDDRSRMGAEQYAVAAQVVNSIPGVIAAPPGLSVRPVATPARRWPPGAGSG